jgi:hypothetical protein
MPEPWAWVGVGHHHHMPDAPDDVSERLTALAEVLARNLGEHATVQVEPTGPNEVLTTISPTSTRALSVQMVRRRGDAGPHRRA